MKIPFFGLQIVYSGLVFAILSVLKPNDIDVWDGIKGAFLVLGMTVFLISILKAIPAIYKDLRNNSLSSNKSIRIVINFLDYATVGLFVMTLGIAVLSFVGMLFSNVSVTTTYILLLVPPLWLSVRVSIKRFLREIEANK